MTYHFSLENKERMELLELGRFPHNLLRNIELPGESIRIPASY